MAIGNASLTQAVIKLHGSDQNQAHEYYLKNFQVSCWIRPNSGAGNPRTKIEQEGDLPISDAVVLLREAVKHFRQEHTVLSLVPEPKWVDDAERLLSLIPR